MTPPGSCDGNKDQKGALAKGGDLAHRLYDAILDDNRIAAKALLKEAPFLAKHGIDEARCETKLPHWIYVQDTMLHAAAAGHRVEIVKMLLEAGANPNAALNHRASQPLHYAADGFVSGESWDGKRQVETIRLLLDAGAAIDGQDKNGATPLHRAVRTRCAGAVRCLLAARASVTIKNKSGSTPFHLAVQNTGRGGSGAERAKAGQREIIEIFLKEGVSPSLKDAKGKSVLQWAKSDWIREILL